VHDVFDAVNANTKATGYWKGKPPDFPLAPRPQIDTQSGNTATPKTASVKDIYARFTTGR
jgi:hypothetical protein